MKKLILAIFIITGLAACKSDPGLSTQNQDIHLLSDSTSYNNNAFSDTNTTVKAEDLPAKVTEQPHNYVRTRTVAKSHSRMKTIAPVATTTGVSTTAVPPVVTTPPVVPAPSTPQGSTVGKSTGNTSTASTGSGTTVQKKKGMNKATQGAIIGGVAGAVGDAIISKKKGVGAVIGGLAGAAGGYIIGKKMDKKEQPFMIE